MYVGPDVVKLVVVNTEVTAAKVLVGVHDVLNSLRDKEDLYTELTWPIHNGPMCNFWTSWCSTQC